MDILKKIVDFRGEDCPEITNNGVRCKNAFVYSKGKQEKNCSDYCLKNLNSWLKKVPTKVIVGDKKDGKESENKIKVITINLKTEIEDGKYIKTIEKDDNFLKIFQKYIKLLINENRKVINEIPIAKKKLEKMLKLFKKLNIEDLNELMEEVEDNIETPFEFAQSDPLPEYEGESERENKKDYKKLKKLYDKYKKDYENLIESHVNDMGTYYFLIVKIYCEKDIPNGSKISFPTGRFISNNKDWNIINDFSESALELTIVADKDDKLYIL